MADCRGQTYPRLPGLDQLLIDDDLLQGHAEDGGPPHDVPARRRGSWVAGPLPLGLKRRRLFESHKTVLRRAKVGNKEWEVFDPFNENLAKTGKSSSHYCDFMIMEIKSLEIHCSLIMVMCF